MLCLLQTKTCHQCGSKKRVADQQQSTCACPHLACMLASAKLSPLQLVGHSCLYNWDHMNLSARNKSVICRLHNACGCPSDTSKTLNHQANDSHDIFLLPLVTSVAESCRKPGRNRWVLCFRDIISIEFGGLPHGKADTGRLLPRCRTESGLPPWF